MNRVDNTRQSKWLSTSPGKRWTEKYFLWYSVFWISWFGAIVLTEAYENFQEWEYMYVGLAMALPCLLGPLLLFPGQGEPITPVLKRFFLHANLWIAILSFVGNYFWTHYFYNLLGAAYTLPAHRLNDVRITAIESIHFSNALTGSDCDVSLHPCVLLHLSYSYHNRSSSVLDKPLLPRA